MKGARCPPKLIECTNVLCISTKAESRILLQTVQTPDIKATLWRFLTSSTMEQCFKCVGLHSVWILLPSKHINQDLFCKRPEHSR